MENLLESNERTLVIFDLVCMGLAECLALVHSDIKKMTEHRNQLSAYQREMMDDKFGGATLTKDITDAGACTATIMNGQYVSPQLTGDGYLDARNSKSFESVDKPKSHAKRISDTQTNEPSNDDDPHHLARLKLLDKRLADSFSQALSMCDQQKTSLAKRHQQQQSAATNRGPSILQILLGKSSSSDKSSSKFAGGKEAKSQRPIGSEHEQRSAMIEDINQQTRLALQYSKQLEAHLFRIEDLRSRYEIHLRMGMAVRGMSKAYLSGSSSPSSSPALMGTLSSRSNSNSLKKQRAQLQTRLPLHTSSFVVNDSSSSLGTQSSLSSLNLLSSWSFSRRNKQLRQNQQQQQQQQLAGQYDERSITSPHRRYVSTISLDRQSRSRSKHALGGLASKLISPMNTEHLQQPYHCHQQASQREPSPDYYDDQDDHYPDYLPPVVAPSQSNHHQDQNHVQYNYNNQHRHSRPHPQKYAHQEDSADYNERASSFVGNNHCEPDYYREDVQQTPPLSRPLSQYNYGDYGFGAIPTTTGTLAGVKYQSPELNDVGVQARTSLGHQASPMMKRSSSNGSTSLHKSASHSSLKRAHKMAQQQTACQTIVANNKTNVKDFIENINRLEEEFESLMGTFMLNIEDIQGFARVCQGDVFEVNIRYGETQKFKSKISVLKDSRQKCDNRQVVFKAKIADVIAIKAYEYKGLGKKVLLGNKLCETRDLFTARSQMMTISLNQTGSIKLNLVITWNPLHMIPSSSSTGKVSCSTLGPSFHLAQKASN